MAALAISILQAAEAAIPGFLALWNAIAELKQKNPSLSPAQVVAMAQAMESQIGTLDADTLATLAQIQATTTTQGT